MSIASEWSRDRTPSAELRAAWRDLLAAAREAGYAVDELVRPPATPDQIAAAEQAIGRRLPDDLADLYLLSDGQVDWLELTTGRVGARGRGRWVGALFGAGWSFDPLPQLVSGYRTWADIRGEYSANDLATDFDEMVEVRGDDPVQKLYTCPDWLPFATDGGGNALAVDRAPAPGGTVGHVIVIGSDEDLRRVIAPSVRALLQLCTRRLRAAVAEPDVDQGVWLYTLEVPEPSNNQAP